MRSPSPGRLILPVLAGFGNPIILSPNLWPSDGKGVPGPSGVPDIAQFTQQNHHGRMEGLVAKGTLYRGCWAPGGVDLCMCVKIRCHCKWRHVSAHLGPGQCWGQPACSPPSNTSLWPPPTPGVEVVGSLPLTVSSVQMECTWVPNITEVKMRKSSPSKHSRMRRITVVGGEKELHSAREGTRRAQGCHPLPTATTPCPGLQSASSPAGCGSSWMPQALASRSCWGPS